MKKTTKKKQLMKAKKQQSFSRAKLLPHSLHVVNNHLPSPNDDSTSELVVSLVTQTLIPHYGMWVVAPFFYSHIKPLQTEQITVIWEHWSRQIRLSSLHTYNMGKGVKNTSVHWLNTLQSKHTHAHTHCLVITGHQKTSS